MNFSSLAKKMCLSFMIFFPLVIFCQDKISGKVVSENYKPLEGASVFIPNTTIGTLTDNKGEFMLDHIQPGNIKIVISFIGYKTVTANVNINKDKPYTFMLSPNVHDLEGVIMRRYEKDGWAHFGDVFSSAFIGNSVYANQCVIKNKDEIKFTYSQLTHQLEAFTDVPLVIENNALGYIITVTLADFTFNTDTKNVDYQHYSYFTEMTGSKKEMSRWKKNRQKVYDYSLMRFMRTLYNGKLSNAGYEIHKLEKKKNEEKQRVQDVYRNRFVYIKDSLNSIELKETMINKMIEQSFERDSLKYYRKILEQDDRTSKLHKEHVKEKDIITKTDSSTAIFHFDDYLQVTYRKKEPEEYSFYKNPGTTEMSNQPGVVTATMLNTALSFPVTELILQQGIPVEINETGYFANIDLYINGFWGWWEKLATKLPYGYQP